MPEKVKKPFYKKIWVWVLIILILIMASLAIFKLKDTADHSAPYYSKKNLNKEILSTDNDKMNDYQEDQFYSIARGLVHSEFPSLDMKQFDDDSLYVKKVKGTGTYFVDYVAELPSTKRKFETSATLTLKNADLRGTSKFTYKGLKSDFTSFIENMNNLNESLNNLDDSLDNLSSTFSNH
ncbi:conserved domain protein [Weissella oryzae SG25]|uniref:Conserved domain protein n=1 Tax=Weissella oryzae (strain DSM 25784 / JCM 18191 / LMG 30913 / SG25) TaxID=1329250 RepID=A0A069CVQ6_WEIOS|nr:hypothetical protein [Weissella oryzae]GAK31865.1 conserved domain protein [Weissella oryzae SG25]